MQTYRLARLFREDTGELFSVLRDVFGHLHEQGLALSHCGLGPRFKGYLGSGDGILEVGGSRERTGPKLILGPGVSHGMILLAASQLIIDNVEELKLHLKGFDTLSVNSFFFFQDG